MSACIIDRSLVQPSNFAEAMESLSGQFHELQSAVFMEEIGELRPAVKQSNAVFGDECDALACPRFLFIRSMELSGVTVVVKKGSIG